MQCGLQTSLEEPSGDMGPPPFQMATISCDLEADGKVPCVLPCSLPLLESLVLYFICALG